MNMNFVADFGFPSHRRVLDTLLNILGTQRNALRLRSQSLTCYCCCCFIVVAIARYLFTFMRWDRALFAVHCIFPLSYSLSKN